MSEKLPMYTMHKGKCVSVWEADPKVVETTIADAERLMGIRKCLDGSLLEPPQEGSELWEYATVLLLARPPFVFADSKLVSLSELEI